MKSEQETEQIARQAIGRLVDSGYIKPEYRKQLEAITIIERAIKEGRE